MKKGLKALREQAGITQLQMARIIGKSIVTYKKKEAGEVGFSDTEKIIIMKTLGMNIRQFSDVWFDGLLPVE